MSLRDSRGYKATLYLLTIACLGAAGYLGYRTFFATSSPTKILESSEAAYARGVEAYGQKNWGEAATRFDEANLLANKLFETLKTAGEKIPAEEVKQMIGKLTWVKARAIRDRAYAKAQADGKPLREFQDPQYGESYRTIAQIPDPQEQAEARNAMLGAANETPSVETVKEALRYELVLTQIDWSIVEPLLKKALELNDKDVRALLYSARHEFDQPPPGNERGTITEPKRKDADRINKARSLLATAKQNNAPYWATIGLEAEILDWPLQTAVDRKLKPDAIATAEKAIDQLLFTPETGAIGVAGRGEKLTGLGRADTTGLLNVLKIGAERAHTEARKPGGNNDRMKAVARAALDVANKLADDPTAKGRIPEILATLADVATVFQSHTIAPEPAAWREYESGLDALVAKAGDGLKTNPAYPPLLLRLAMISMRNADHAARAGDTKKAQEYREQGLKRAEEGVKVATEMKLSARLLEEFHLLLAERRILGGEKSESIEPHLDRLRKSDDPRHKRIAQFLDAGIAYNQGKLEKSRTTLRALVANGGSDEILLLRAYCLLARAEAGVGDHAGLLGALKQIEERYQKLEQVPEARAAAEAIVGGPDVVASYQVSANLALATQTLAKFVRDNPGQQVPLETINGWEKNAETQMKKLRSPSRGDREARLAFVGYYFRTTRRKEAETRLESLASDYPDDLEILKARCEILAAPTAASDGPRNANGVAAADVVIRKFLKDFPGHKSAKVFYAGWLIDTNRPDRAIEYLRDPVNFPGGRDSTADRVLGLALERTGQREEAQKLLSRLAPEAQIDTILLHVATTKEATEKQLKEALGRYEDQGFFRIYEATLRFGEGKYEEAARGYASALEFTRVAAAARTGLQRALLAYAGAEPGKARDMAMKFASELPNEPSLYLVAADASIYLDEIGTPTDKWEQTKTAHAALNRWEVAARKTGVRQEEIDLTQSRFHLLAGNLNAAKAQAVAGHNRSPKHIPTLMMCAELHLLPPAEPKRAREFYDKVKAESPTYPSLPYLDARILELSDDAPGAIAVYERLLADSPNDPSPYPALLGLLASKDQKESALRRAQEWYAKFPDNTMAVGEVVRWLTATGKKADAMKVADEFVAKQVATARKKLAEQIPARPPAEIEKIADEVRANALFNTVGGFTRAKEYAESEARLGEVLKILPNAEAAQSALGDIAIIKQEWDKAIRLYAEILKRNPRNGVAGNNLAWILAEKKNDPAAALAIVEEARKGPSGNRPVGAERLRPDFLDTIGVVYTKLNRADKFPEMRTMFEAAAQRYPSDPRMFLYLGTAQAALGERSKALDSLSEATRLAGTKNGLPADQNKTVVDAAEAIRKRLRS